MSEHGIARGFWGGCRCLPCRAAVARYNLGRIEARKAGDWQGYVSATNVRKHLKRFKNLQAVADVTGMNASYLRRIRSGRNRHVRAQTEKRILAIEVEAIEKQRSLFASDGVFVSAVPVRRMIRILERQGFNSRVLGQRLKLSGDLRIKGKTVRAWNAMRIEKFYNQLTAEAA